MLSSVARRDECKMRAGKISDHIAKHKPQRDTKGDQTCMVVSADEIAQGLFVTEHEVFPERNWH
jgi:hypothetical protein